jgi:hypothetical protein
MSALVHDELMHYALRGPFLSLLLQHILSLLRLLWTHLRINLRRRTRIRQLDLFDITRIFQERRVRHKSAVSHPLAILQAVLLAVPAELCDKFATPAEPSRGYGRVFRFIFFEVFEEFEDSWAGDPRSTPVHEWEEGSHREEDVPDFGDGEARSADGFHRVHERGWEDEA